MAKATHETTRPAPGPIPQLSIVDLGRRLAAADAAYSQHDQDAITSAGKATKSLHETAMRNLFDQESAIRQMILTMPARTLADAAVQIAAIDLAASNLEDNQQTEEELSCAVRALRRLVYSALPVIAESAGLDMEAMGWGKYPKLRADAFCGVERLA
jgi:hypothetical protein